jgi:uncharacterized protein (DUF697 family)
LGVLRLLSTGLRVVRPIQEAVRTAEAIVERHGQIAILPGDPAATRRLRELLGSPPTSPDEDALSILAVTPGTDLAAGAAAMVRARQRHPEDALAVVIGTRAEREALERALVAEHRLEASNVLHVASLEGPGEEAVIERVIDMLGEAAVVAGRRTPALRPAIGRRIVHRAARQAAGVAAVPLGGAAMPVLTLQQIKMVGQLAVLHGRPLDADRVLAALSILGAGFGWRALGRSAVGLVPGAGWAVQGALAYGVTRSLGEAVQARLAAGHELVEGPGLQKIKPTLERLLDRVPVGP